MEKLCELEPIDDSVTDAIPPNVLEALRNYAKYGLPPGHFVHAVITNDLSEAIARADSHSLAAIQNICMFVYNCFPTSIWGSQQAFRNHLEKGRELVESK